MDIENKINSLLGPTGMANRLIEVGNAFIHLHQLGTTKLMFKETGVINTGAPHCKTEACHGGWLGVLLRTDPDTYIPGKPKVHPDTFESDEAIQQQVLSMADPVGSKVWFMEGPALLASYLKLRDTHGGSREYDLFPEWADQNPELWGNYFGGLMFTNKGYQAFGCDRTSECTLELIGRHYHAVANRLLEETVKQTNDALRLS